MKKIRTIFFFLFVSTVFSLISISEAKTNPLGWTARRAEIWNNIQKSNQDNWWREIQSHKINDNFGLRDAMLYKITGDQEYAQKSWNKVKGFCGENYRGSRERCTENYKGGCFDNCKRDRFGRMAIAYSLIADALPLENKANYKDILTLWTKQSFCEADHSIRSQGIRFTDTDELVGNYFGLVTFALAIQKEDPEFSKHILEHASVKSSFSNCFDTKALGGVDATGQDRSTMRNVISKYIRDAQGEWLESSQYNLASVGTYMMMGIEAINEFYRTNKFPEFNPQDYTDAMMALMTPDMKQTCKWGDNQDHVRGLFPYQFVGYSAANAYLTKNPQAMLTFSLAWKKNEDNALPDTWYWWLDPNIPRQTPSGQRSYDNKGKLGWSTYSTGFGRDESLFCTEASAYTYVDHESKGITNFNLYRNGNWAFTNPRGYYSGNNEEEGFTNGVWIGGVGQGMREASGKSAYESAPGYLYQVYTTAGNQKSDRNGPAAEEWVHEFNRSLVYLRNADNSDTIVIFDRVNSCDWLHDPKCMTPSNIANLDLLTQKRGCGKKYDKGCSSSADGKHKIFFHPNTQVKKDGNTFSWMAKNGETVYLNTFIDGYSYDQRWMSDIWAKGAPYFIGGDFGNKDARELTDFHKLVLIPDQIAGFQTWLHVLQAGGANPTLTKINSDPSPEKAEGIHISFNGADEKVLIFNATENTPPPPSTIKGSNCKEGASGRCVNHDPKRFEKTVQLKYFKKGFITQFESTGAIKIFIFDLDPVKVWTVELNGEKINPFKVSSQGVAIISAEPITGKQSLRIYY